ncbi:Acg family FMN-binding oxidoreductase [Cryptosporangium minutisporangium]|uniref:NAD(P)H nitroreductase n=1 Tax=Cryptosporangium minutisporangium TaxID=113569 RepID=A0ABP6T8Q2_9ACTN
MTPSPAPPPRPERPLSAALDEAATAALRAPSVLNTQPWRWVVDEGSLDLRADPQRRLAALDPEGRMLTTSCGAALEYAVIALRVEGYLAQVELLPDASDPDLLATIYPAESRPAVAEDYRRYQTTLRRHTDRRPFGPDLVTEDQLDALARAASVHGVQVHVVETDQVPVLAAAAAFAATFELAGPAERAELEQWTHRPPGASDGLPVDVTVPGTPRPVPLRPFAEDAEGQLAAGPGDDSGARYLILWGDQDGRRAWLRAGQALSAVLLSAAELGLATSPMTDLVEVASTRLTVRRLLYWQGHPYVVLRVGVAAADLGVPGAHRRSHDEVVEVDETPPGATPA